MNTLYTIYNPKLNRLGTEAWGGETLCQTSELTHRAADGLVVHSTERERERQTERETLLLNVHGGE